MEGADFQHHTPKDKHNLLYLTFLLHGIGILLPWNTFITVKSYFTYKLGKEYTGQNLIYANWFLQFLGFSSQVPSVVFTWLNLFVRMDQNFPKRIGWSILVEIVIFVITVALAMVDSSEWPGLFFWITILSMVLLNSAGAVYQNTLFGVVAKLPPKYSGAIISGTNICGTFTSVAHILTDIGASRKSSVVYYFITALLVLLICFDTYYALPLNRYYRYHDLKNKKEFAIISLNKRIRPPYFYIFKTALPQLLNVFLVFFVTLSIFPAVQAKIPAVNPDFFISKKYFTSITCFLTFNLSALIGTYLHLFWIWPKPKLLWIPVALRLLYIPLFLFSNYHTDEEDLTQRTLPVLINNDWAYWFIGTTMGLTSGYFSAIALMYIPETVEPQYVAIAGMFGSAMIILGVFIGVLSSFIWPWLI